MRPQVVFDPANPEHRKYYYNYIKTNTWSGCPYRFTVYPNLGITKGVMDRLLLEFYLTREYGSMVL
jgi:hypothetical protein